MTSLIAKRCLQAATLFALVFTAPGCGDLDDGGSTAPTVLSTSLLGGDTDVSLNESVRVTFDLAMDPATLTAATFTLTKPAPWPGGPGEPHKRTANAQR